MKTLSLVVPCFNESLCIDSFINVVRLLNLKNPIEFVFVDDGSTDETLEIIKTISESDSSVRYVSFSRNFGKEAALLAGLRHATGELIVTMDCDLQHRPELLKSMLQGIEKEGYDCVAIRRVNRIGEPPVRSWFAHRFYALMNRYSDVKLVDGAMDYRMMTRQVVNAILLLSEVNRFTKGIYQWVGFKTKWLEAENAERVAGNTKWSFRGLIAYSIQGILAFSTAPLQIASVLGLLFCLVSLSYFGYIIVKWFITGDQVAGWPTLMCVVLLLGGFQLFCVGVLGTYLAGLYKEVKHRPHYIVKEKK